MIERINGTVTDFDFRGRKFSVIDSAGKVYTVNCDFFFPTAKGDNVSMLVNMVTFSVVTPPLGFVGKSDAVVKETLFDCISKSGVGKREIGEYCSFLEEKRKDKNQQKTLSDFIDYHVLRIVNFNDNTSIKELNSPCFERRGGESLVYVLADKWCEKRLKRAVYLFGITKKEIEESYLSLEKIMEKLLTNPYSVISIPIEKGDAILKRQGKEEPKLRQVGVVARVIRKKCYDNAWMCVPLTEIEGELKGTEDMTVEEILENLFADYAMIPVENKYIYLSYFHQVETGVAERFRDLILSPCLPIFRREKEEREKRSNEVEILFDHPTLTEVQKEAIISAISSPVTLICGPAGSGKTTIIQQIVNNLKRLSLQYVIGAPTGKAAAKLREFLKDDTPSTLHRLLALMRKGGNLVSFDYLIIDESSMLTDSLLYSIFRLRSQPFRIVLIGDPNQLPPIGPGNLFSEVLKSGRFPTFFLEKVHRNDDEILLNCVRILKGEKIIPNSGFRILGNEEENIFNLIHQFRDSGVDSRNFVVITPRNVSLNSLNDKISTIYNDLKDPVTYETVTYRVGDRVMMTENNYEIEVMNGEEGLIIETQNTGFRVEFRTGRFFFFFKDHRPEWEQKKDAEGHPGVLTVSLLDRSFAQTIHKAQGSEYDFVILYIPSEGMDRFFSKNMFYTAATRAKYCLLCIANERSLNYASRNRLPPRMDRLSILLQDLVSVESVVEKEDEGREEEN